MKAGTRRRLATGPAELRGLGRGEPQAGGEVGRHNSYGHPTAQALGALRAVPRVYRTDRDGTVRVTVEHGRVTVTAGG